MQPQDYATAPVVTVQCPRCGQGQDIPEVNRITGGLEFSGVCASPIPGGGFCSTTMRLMVTAHVFPAASGEQASAST